MLILNVVYVLIALAMIVLILMQRGAGAQAGSGFGGGASGTVFGSRGSSNFLSKSTKWLAIVFMSISLFMAWQVKNQTSGTSATPSAASSDLGVMGNIPQAPAGSTAPAANTNVPPATDVPAAQPAPAQQSQPAEPVKQ